MIHEEDYISILKEELVPALGCTEPIAIAYASAKARQILGTFPEGIEIYCSGNIIKNVKSVLVPNSNGMKGIGAAAVSRWRKSGPGTGSAAGNSSGTYSKDERVAGERVFL